MSESDAATMSFASLNGVIVTDLISVVIDCFFPSPALPPFQSSGWPFHNLFLLFPENQWAM